METQLHPENAGTEFDKWLDWNGTSDDVEQQTSTLPLVNTGRQLYPGRPIYPISPTATVHGDLLNVTLNSHIHTAPSSVGPLTPSHSSGSPELYSATHIRLSGDTLRDEDSLFAHNHLKRKLSLNHEEMSPEEKVPKARPGGSKRPHNVIEKRYRANLNEKITELRDSVPSLRVLQKARSKESGNAGSDDEDLDGLTPSGKLNKASILTKAVEYIRHLEFRNKRLEDENKSLKDRLQTLDQVIARGGHNAERAAAFTTENVIEEAVSPLTTPSDKSESKTQTAGRIEAPKSWKRIRQSQQSSDHYGHTYQNPSERSRLGGKWTSRIILGSVAGLMLMEGFSESDQGTDSREKGLFGIPLEILDGWAFLVSPRAYLTMFAEYCHAGGAIPLIKGFLALTMLAFFIFSYLFNSKPRPDADGLKSTEETPQAASPSSPIELRRRAWSTSMQALRLPHHSFFPEWLAVTTEWITYSIRYLLGPDIYSSLTGLTIEDELARIKNWDIAIDAQLAGGDTEISRSRVLLTIFGSGTLPQTPMRLMQTALHSRVLLWHVGLPGTTIARIANFFATFFANRKWRRARQLHERLSARDNDRLPGYLNYLLQMDCDDVFNALVTQRASNLMYNQPTSELAEDSLMDVVVEDYAIRSPLDAVAAWRSTCALHEALTAALQSPNSPDLLREHVQAALEIAPPGSTAETRALAVHAVLSPGRRLAFYAKAQEALSVVSASSPTEHEATSAARLSTEHVLPFFIDSSTPASARPEVAACLGAAKIMLTLEQERDLPKALLMLSEQGRLFPLSTTMLTTAAHFFVLHHVWRASGSGLGPVVCTNTAIRLTESMATMSASLGADEVEQAQALSSAIEFLRSTWETTVAPSQVSTRRHSMVSNDTGYGSLSEHEDDGHKPRLGLERTLIAMSPVTSEKSTGPTDV